MNAESTVRIPELELSPNSALHLGNAIARQHGLVLFCGSTGSGKTTTVDALLAGLKPKRRPVTLTDITPEVLETLDTSHQVDAGDLRNDDAVQITVELACRTLVLAVLRSGRSRPAIERLLEMGTSKQALKAAAPVIVTQQLCRRLCKHCRVPAVAGPDSLQFLGIPAAKLSITAGHVYEAGGCTLCKDGYAGSVPIFEILLPTHSVEDIEFSEVGSLVDDGLLKVVAGYTTLAELRRVL